jgi:integrase/recombinase XerD
MLTEAVESFLALRRAAGFMARDAAYALRSFARFAADRGQSHVDTPTTLEWAALAATPGERARRLGHVIRFARHARAEDPRHQVPPNQVFGHRARRRPPPFIFSQDEVHRLVAAAFALPPAHSLRPQVFGTLLALLAATGLRIGEALALRLGDVTPAGLVIRCTKFRKRRLVVLHPTAAAGLERYLVRRRQVRTTDDHVFLWPPDRPLHYSVAKITLRKLVTALGLHGGPGLPNPHLHSLRHTFAVRALEAVPLGDRRRIGRHMVALSTYLGHTRIADTYWYLEATPQLLTDIAVATRAYAGGAP